MQKDIVQNTLQHFGILGMKWGVRRYQNKDGSLTPEGEKRYKPTKQDKITFGERGAQRIADRMNKGDSRAKAAGKELATQLAIGTAFSVGTATISYLAFSGEGKELFNAGKDKIKSMWNSRNNINILDASGNVITKYHEKIKSGSAIISGLLGK